MGFASYLVWRDGGETLNGPAGLPLTLFAIQLVLNYAWSFIFFYYHNLEWVFIFNLKVFKKEKSFSFYYRLIYFQAFYEVIALLIGIASCVYTFKSVNETASYLMMPYLAWVSFASLLTFTIWRMNLPANKKKI
jgi:tryptophan-rich sensory protein